MKLAALLSCLCLVASAPRAEDDLSKAPACTHCGMDRAKFAHSRMLIEYDDGTQVGTCSLHCAALDMAMTLDKAPRSILVGDAATKKLIPAETAVWVLGGSKPGVMTRRAKWAFETRGAADAFVKENGGQIVSFDDAVKSAYEDMHADTKSLREKRKAMRQRAAGPHAHP